jgi:BrnA antitoxin of type II toxin-antitoxin system
MKKHYDFSRAKRGPVLPAPPGKTRITIRIDDDVLEWFRKQAHEAGGGNYQTMMNHALRDHMEREAEPLEETLRRVLREVLPDSSERPGRKTSRKRKSAKKPSASGKRGKK